MIAEEKLATAINDGSWKHEDLTKLFNAALHGSNWLELIRYLKAITDVNELKGAVNRALFNPKVDDPYLDDPLSDTEDSFLDSKLILNKLEYALYELYGDDVEFWEHYLRVFGTYELAVKAVMGGYFDDNAWVDSMVDLFPNVDWLSVYDEAYNYCDGNVPFDPRTGEKKRVSPERDSVNLKVIEAARQIWLKSRR
jgi:hypothetical protein